MKASLFLAIGLAVGLMFGAAGAAAYSSHFGLGPVIAEGALISYEGMNRDGAPLSVTWSPRTGASHARVYAGMIIAENGEETHIIKSDHIDKIVLGRREGQ